MPPLQLLDQAMPVLLNISMISTALFLAPRLDNPDLALAIGIFLGGLLQFLFQIPFLKKAGLLVKPKWAWHDEGVAKIRRLMIPALFGVSVSQINLLLDTVIASLVAKNLFVCIPADVTVRLALVALCSVVMRYSVSLP